LQQPVVPADAALVESGWRQGHLGPGPGAPQARSATTSRSSGRQSWGRRGRRPRPGVSCGRSHARGTGRCAARPACGRRHVRARSGQQTGRDAEPAQTGGPVPGRRRALAVQAKCTATVPQEVGRGRPSSAAGA
jgi:hypothetical protein